MSGAVETLGPMRSAAASMQRILRRARALAMSDAPVLILGATGTGKEMLGRSLHEVSGRQPKLFVSLCCTGLSAAALSCEVAGAPGNQGRGPGALGRARGGTLVLDDVGSLDGSGQAELLRCLNSEPSLSRTPAKRGRSVRLITTGTEDLARAVQTGRFRPDLYHRLAAARIELPLLRERRADIAGLALEFMAAACSEHNLPLPALEPAAAELLESYSFPGNVRELRDVMELALLQSCGAPRLRAADLVGLLYTMDDPTCIEIPLGWPLAEAEKAIILQTLASCRGNRQEAAGVLGISRRTLYEKLTGYRAKDGLTVPATRGKRKLLEARGESAPAHLGDN